jgi:membrane associated rhomboid family serine protease
VIPLRDDNPVERFPIVTYTLLILNVLAFAWQLGLPGVLASPDLFGAMGAHLEDSVRRGGVIPYEVFTLRDVSPRDVVPPPFTIVTSMFLHGGVWHIAFNMLFLWIFGNNVEDALGRLRFVAFYLAAGIAAALVQMISSAVAGDPGMLRVPMVGASGAIAGVLAAYLVLFPHARVLTLVIIFVLIRIVPLPAGWFIGLWFAGQLVSVFLGANTGVAFFAHIGGFGAGFLLVRLVGRRSGWRAHRRAYW